MTIEELHKEHFHELETERLILRPVRLEDAEDMFAYTSIAESFRYLRRNPHMSVEEDRAFIQNVLNGYREHREFLWGICLRGKDRLIGTVRLHNFRLDESCCETSHLIHPEYMGQGIGTETEKRMVRFTFDELGLSRMQGCCAAENVGSERIMQKGGLKKKAFLPHYAEFHGVWYDFLLYEIEKGDAK